jgi:endoglucanase
MAIPLGDPAGITRSPGSLCSSVSLVDDCEDNDGRIAPIGGRSGYWYTYGDRNGTTLTPAMGSPFVMARGGANASVFAARIQGRLGKGRIVFSGFGLNFVDPKGAYDASAYSALSFWAKVGAGAATHIRLKVSDGNTDPEGKVCTECFNNFGVDLELSTTWTQYTIPFATMKQLPGWGVPRPAALDAKKVYGVLWELHDPGADFDLWIDEVALERCP